MYEYAALVTRIVDGDTIDLVVDLGLRVKIDARCRLYGINAPERGTPGSGQATLWLSDKIPPGTRVNVHTYKDRTEKYGRWLVDVFLDGECINDSAVEAAVAVRWDGKGGRPA